MDDLENFLTGESTDAPITDDAPQSEGPVRDESGRFAPKEKGEPQIAETVPPTDDEPMIPLAAQKDERRKRQEAEQRIADLEKQIQAFQQPAEPAAPPPSVFEDEQAFGGHLVNTAVSQASLNARLDMSEMLASQNHEDFDAMKDKFLQMMAANPALQQQAMAAKHPWEKAYQLAKNAATMEELGATDLTTLEAKLREKITAEMAAQPAQQPNLPASLADAQSSRSAATGAGQGPPSLQDILSGR